MNIDLSEFVVSLAVAAVVLVLLWYAADMRSILKSSQRKNQLAVEGRWNDLDNYYKGALRTYRPFVWLHRRYLMPGNLEAQYALFLYNQGRLEEARAKVEQAIRKIDGKPVIFRSIHQSETFNTLCGAFRARTLILTGLGLYDEAREAAAHLERLSGSGGRPNVSLVLLEYYCGHFDEALALAKAVPPGDVQYDATHGVMALVYSMKGEFEQAMQALAYEPSNMSKVYSRAGLELVSGTPEGAKLIELQQKKMAGVMQPGRLLFLASVYNMYGKFEEANHVLDQAEKLMGPEPGVQTAYCRHRACSLAALGKAAEAEDYIGRMRAIVQKMPKRSLLWETHFSTGQAYAHLKRPGDALTEFSEAQRFALHPIEKHVTAFWMARANEAAGNRREAIQCYEIVVADAVPSWMREKAVEALAQQKG